MSNKNPAAVRVCEISDIECSRGCGTGACKKETVANAALKAHALDCQYITSDNPFEPCTCGFGGPNDVIAADAASPNDDSHRFKNFHRLLCERFGYVHDEKDWRRDQISLIEWIAKQVKSAQPDERAALIAERDAAIMSTHRQAACIQQCAAHIGPDTSATIDGLPLAVKRLIEERDAARASAPQAVPTDELLTEVAEEIMKGMRAIATWEPRRDFAVRVMRERLAARQESST
jgi:hypothetical protein